MLFRGDYDEKRQFARMAVDCPALIRVDGEDKSYHAVVKDLSASGLQLSCADSLPVAGRQHIQVIQPEALFPAPGRCLFRLLQPGHGIKCDH